MTVATRQIRFQTGSNPYNQQDAQIVETFNTLTELILATGMEAVPESEYPGQVGVFVLSAPGPGQTQFARSTVAGLVVYGYNMFKHPTGNLYVQVGYAKNGHNSWGFNDYTIRAYRSLTGGVPGQEWGTEFSNLGYLSTSAAPAPATTPMLCYASCGPDHFWIGSAALPFDSSPANANWGFPLNGLPIEAVGAAFFITPQGDLVAIGPQRRWFQLGGTQPLMAGPSWGNSGSTLGWSTRNAHYTAVLPADSDYWTAYPEGTACTLPDPARAMVDGRIRLSQAQLIVAERYQRLGFGFCPAGSLPDTTVLEVDLGKGPAKYICLHGWGSGNVYPNLAPQAPSLSSMTTILLPWNE